MARKQLPAGFTVSGVHCGVKRFNKDLALIFSEAPCAIAGVFTKNKLKAAPVLVTKEVLAKGMPVQAVVVNSGNANCCTGRSGTSDAKRMIQAAADQLGLKFWNVCVASTGIIGKRLPIDKIVPGIRQAVKRLSTRGLMSLAKAILTTDKKRKVSTAKLSVSGKDVTITGVCKGAGMVHPNMATMLCFIMTDAAVEHSALKAALRECTEKSFNVITVDGDMSTNDCVLVMANGMARNKPIKKGTKEFRAFREALGSVALELAKEIVADGEGATKLIEVKVTGAKTERSAEQVARVIANSCLVKTSVHGRDPNWGRIASSVGASMAEEVRQNKVEICLDGLCMFRYGKFTNPPAQKVSRVYKRKNVNITVNLNAGRKIARMFTCDLSKRYVEINAHYTT